MKKLLFILLLFCSYSYGQVNTTKIVKIPNATATFVDNIPAFIKIINQTDYKEYLVLRSLLGSKSISTCILGIDIIESGFGSYKYNNDSTGTTNGYVNLARFYSTLILKLNKGDTAAMLSPYATKSLVNTKLNKTDTTGLLGTKYDLTHYLRLTGGELTGTLYGTQFWFVAPINYATITSWTYNSDASSSYGTNAVGYAGANRKIFLAGIGGVSNGFTVDWTDATSKFLYTFHDGDISLGGNITAVSLMKNGGLGSQILLANGSVVDTSRFARISQIQSDWNQTNTGILDYIKNKPSVILNRFTTPSTPQANSYINISGTGIFGTNVQSPQFFSSATTGTQPFVTNSITLNYNLNADLLDGKDGSYYHNYDSLANKPTIPDITGKRNISDTTANSGTATVYQNSLKVNKSTTVNGHALSGNISVTTTDLSLDSLVNHKQWYSGWHPSTFAGYGLTGGTLTTPLIGTTLRMTGEVNYATADFFTYNGDATGAYGVSVISYPGANRKLFKVGFDTTDSGLNIDWIHSTSRFAYKFNQGDITVDGKFIKWGGTGSQILLANGSVVDTSHFSNGGISLTTTGTNGPATLISSVLNIPTKDTTSSGSYTPTLTNTYHVTTSSYSTAYYSRVGNMVHVMISGAITPSATGEVDLTFTLPIVTSNWTQGIVGIAQIMSTLPTCGNVSIDSESGNAFIFYKSAETYSATYVIQFDYSIN